VKVIKHKSIPTCDLALHDPKEIMLLTYTPLPCTVETLEILFIWEYWPIQPFHFKHGVQSGLLPMEHSEVIFHKEINHGLL
jgi:hypothetical protein